MSRMGAPSTRRRPKNKDGQALSLAGGFTVDFIVTVETGGEVMLLGLHHRAPYLLFSRLLARLNNIPSIEGISS